MSAPRTNLEKERRRHWGPLLGMAIVTIFAVGLMIYWLFEEVAQSDPPPPPMEEPGAVQGSATPADPFEADQAPGVPGVTVSPTTRVPVPGESVPLPEAAD